MPKFPSTYRSLALASLLALSSLGTSGAATDLVSLGTNSFTVATDFSSAPFSQTSTTLSLNVPFSNGQVLAGDLLAGAGAPFNWSLEPDLALSLSSSLAPSATLFVKFQDASFATLATFSVGTASVTSSPGTFNLLASLGSSISSLTNVSALEFVWSGSGASPEAAAITIHSIQSVPEPSTYALLALSGLALGGYALRRRRRA